MLPTEREGVMLEREGVMLRLPDMLRWGVALRGCGWKVLRGLVTVPLTEPEGRVPIVVRVLLGREPPGCMPPRLPLP